MLIFPFLSLADPSYRKLTDAEKKIVEKIDEALGSTVNRTAEFVDLLDGAAGTLDLVGDVLTMTW